MKWYEKLNSRLENDISMNTLIKVIMIFLVVLLFKETDTVWKGIFDKLNTILQPFLLGFIIAYVIRPMISGGERHRISRKIMIPLVYIVILLLIFWLIFTLVPLVYSRLSNFINSIISGVNWLYATYANAAVNGVPDWLQSFVKEAVTALNDSKTWIPNVSKSVPAFFTSVLTNVTVSIITVVISIYMSYDWETIRDGIYRLGNRFSKDSPRYMHAVNDEIGTYIKSLIILMVIKFGEYALIYSALGHPDWLVMALLTSLGLLIPYFGGTIANLVGILTALTMPTSKIILLVIVLVIMANVDSYVIDPMVHSHNTKITPLWALFSVFVGGTVWGAIGIMISIPVYLSIRIILQLKKKSAPKGNASVPAGQ